MPWKSEQANRVTHSQSQEIQRQSICQAVHLLELARCPHVRSVAQSGKPARRSACSHTETKHLRELFAKPNDNIVNELDGSTEPTLFDC